MKAVNSLLLLLFSGFLHIAYGQTSASKTEMITNLAQAKRVFNQYFRNANASLDDYGNVYLGGGSGGDGHCLFRITDVHFDIEERPREPGCADECDERIVVHIQCRRSACIRDPWMESIFYGSAESVDELIKLSTECQAVMFYGEVKEGRAAFEALKRIKDFFHREACITQ